MRLKLLMMINNVAVLQTNKQSNKQTNKLVMDTHSRWTCQKEEGKKEKKNVPDTIKQASSQNVWSELIW